MGFFYEKRLPYFKKYLTTFTTTVNITLIKIIDVTGI